MMKRYSEYKDSGVKWIGEIPTHWEVEPFSRNFSYGKGLPITKADLISSGIAVISYGQIHSKLNSGTAMNDDLVRFVSPKFIITNPQSLLRANDFIFADTSEDIEGAGNCSFNNYQGKIFAGYHTVIARPLKLEVPKYYAYFFQSKNWKSQVQTLVNGVKVYSISKGILKKSTLLIPNKLEQQAIVSYLDGKVAKIDRYIAAAEKKIKALEELKQTIISDAVTHGINPNAKMKDSGIKWIGMVPEHWGKNKIQRLFSFIGSGTTPKGNQSYANKDNGIPWINSGDLNYGYLYECSKYVTLKALQENSALKVYPKGTLLIAMYGASIGKYAITRLEGCTNQACCALSGISSLIDLLFASYLMRPCKQKWIEESFGGTQPNISAEKIKQTWLPLPPLPEQQAIVSYLDRKVSQIEQLRIKELSQIEKLKEYKQRLISDVVTGKVRVTND